MSIIYAFICFLSSFSPTPSTFVLLFISFILEMKLSNDLKIFVLILRFAFDFIFKFEFKVWFQIWFSCFILVWFFSGWFSLEFDSSCCQYWRWRGVRGNDEWLLSELKGVGGIQWWCLANHKKVIRSLFPLFFSLLDPWSV